MLTRCAADGTRRQLVDQVDLTRAGTGCDRALQLEVDPDQVRGRRNAARRQLVDQVSLARRTGGDRAAARDELSFAGQFLEAGISE